LTPTVGITYVFGRYEDMTAEMNFDLYGPVRVIKDPTYKATIIVT